MNMKTAKDLAFKAFCLNIDVPTRMSLFHRADKSNESKEVQIKERFENWWSQNYGNKDQPEFNPELSVFIEGKRYIQAE